MCAIKKSLESLGDAARWVPHEVNPTDCMTKLKGNASQMLQLLRTGRYRLTEEAAELVKRKEYREATGMRNPRPKRLTEDFAPTKRRGMAQAVDTQDQNFLVFTKNNTPYHKGFISTASESNNISLSSSSSSVAFCSSILHDENSEHLDPPKSTNMSGKPCLLYTSPSPRDAHESRMPSSA